MKRFVYGLLMVLLATVNLNAQDKPFSEQVGSVTAGPVPATEPTVVPFITWGGDVATFLANGGLETKPNTVAAKLGLNLKLKAGDKFTDQVKDYVSGKSPYLRGTFQMIGQGADVFGTNPDLKPVLILQMTYSVGDHMVAAEGIGKLNDLKGKKIALQRGGPHLALVDDSLKAAGLTWKDITPVWCDDLTATDNSPAAVFRAGKADAACVISPDMLGLCGGLDQKGSGAEGSVKGSHVVVSTAQANRSIADVYAVRSDYFAKNRDKVERFVAMYLKGTNDLLAAKKEYNDGKGKSEVYMNALKMAQAIYGEAVLPTLEVDAHGLVSDASFVGLPGNVSFFEDAGNLNGFAAKQKSTLDLVTSIGIAKNRFGFEPARLEYRKIATLAGIDYVAAAASTGRIKAEIESFSEDLADDGNTIVSFAIPFEPNQEGFNPDTYGMEFSRVLQSLSTFGNSVIVIRGHSDPSMTIKAFLKAGMEKGILTRSGRLEREGGTGYEYFLRGQKIDLAQTPNLINEIQNGNFVGASENPNETMTAALNLSLVRSQVVKKAIVEYAKVSGINLDASQIQPQGVGIREPVFPKPKSLDEARKNMRVEFRLVKVPAEAIKPSDFDY